MNCKSISWKRILALLAALLVAITLAACADGESETDTLPASTDAVLSEPEQLETSDFEIIDETHTGPTIDVPVDHVHQYVILERSDPTCTDTGVIRYRCSCGDIKTVTVKALGHKVESTTIPATEYDDGSVTEKCARCGQVVSVTNIPHIPIEVGPGVSFAVDPVLLTSTPLTQIPLTFEATLSLPKTVTGRAGSVFANYDGSQVSFSFEIYTNGAPRLYFVHKDKTSTNLVFSNVDIRSDKDVHVALVCEGDWFYCYLNGQMVQKLQGKPIESISPNQLVIGGDLRYGNAQYYKGSIKHVALFTDARTEAEVLADSRRPLTVKGDENLICLYDLTGQQDIATITDLAGHNNLKLEKRWFTKEPVTNYAYSFAVIGDTQIVTYKYPELLHNIYDYVVDNVESKKIAYVIGLGDITDKNNADEWALAKSEIFRMNDLVPYSLVRGNHDKSPEFNSTFDVPEYTGTYEGQYDAKIENTWRTFTAGSVNYLLFTLDYGPSDEVMAWAGDIIEAHPTHKVIITTHAYLYRDGTTLDQNEVCPPATTGGYNNGDHMWDKFVRKYENIVLVLCGHDPTDRVVCTQTTGDHGNTVTQMLIDPQGMDNSGEAIGMVCMFYFSEDGSQMEVEYYSTVKNLYYREDNQFSVTLY